MPSSRAARGGPASARQRGRAAFPRAAAARSRRREPGRRPAAQAEHHPAPHLRRHGSPRRPRAWPRPHFIRGTGPRSGGRCGASGRRRSLEVPERSLLRPPRAPRRAASRPGPGAISRYQSSPRHVELHAPAEPVRRAPSSRRAPRSRRSRRPAPSASCASCSAGSTSPTRARSRGRATTPPSQRRPQLPVGPRRVIEHQVVQVEQAPRPVSRLATASKTASMWSSSSCATWISRRPRSAKAAAAGADGGRLAGAGPAVQERVVRGLAGAEGGQVGEQLGAQLLAADQVGELDRVRGARSRAGRPRRRAAHGGRPWSRPPRGRGTRPAPPRDDPSLGAAASSAASPHACPVCRQGARRARGPRCRAARAHRPRSRGGPRPPVPIGRRRAKGPVDASTRRATDAGDAARLREHGALRARPVAGQRRAHQRVVGQIGVARRAPSRALRAGRARRFGEGRSRKASPARPAVRPSP